jgi:hypothetical protein
MMLDRHVRLTLPALVATLVVAAGGSSAAAATGGNAAMLRDATGLGPSQVTSAPVCAPAAPGSASCDADALVTKTINSLLRPRTGSPLPSPDATTEDGAPADGTPQFLQEAYDLGWLSANRGGGTTVAIVDAFGDPSPAADLNTFRSEFGLPSISDSACSPASITSHNNGGPCIVVANQSGQTDSSDLPATAGGWDIEESLDLDAVTSLCPQCNILFIETNSDFDSDLAAGDAEALRLGAKLISNSFGGPESGDSNYYTATEDQTGDASGAETFVATGDDGAYADGNYPGQANDDQAPYPASEDFMTAVGGTELDLSGAARGINETAWSGAGSACSLFGTRPSWQLSSATGCSGRASSDISADASPQTGLWVYDSYQDGWIGPVGGTSLAAPLTAAYAALTNVNSASTSNSSGLLSGEWAYADAAELNDITSGSNGSACTGANSYEAAQICNAGAGWDGPTGVGSINGGVISSSAGPSLTVPPAGGIDTSRSGFSLVQSISGSSATVDGGVYPNNSATTLWWEYGTDAATNDGTNLSSATATSTQAIAAGSAPVLASPAAISGLQQGSIYYVSECASNNGGSDTTCGNATELPISSGPVPEGAPTLAYSGLAAGDQISISEPTWTQTPTTVSYQWQTSSDASNWTSAGNAFAYAIDGSDIGKFIRVAVSVADGNGTTTAYSNVVQITGASGGGGTNAGGGGTNGSGGSGDSGGSNGSASSSASTPPATIVQAPTLQGQARIGQTLRVSGGLYANAKDLTVSFERCAHVCSVVQQGRSMSYAVRSRDAGYFLTAIVSVAGIYGGANARARVANLIGPVVSRTVGSLNITAPRATLVSGTRTQLLKVARTILRSSHSGSKTYLVTITRATGIRGSLKATFCWRSSTALLSCTTTMKVNAHDRYSAPVGAGDTLVLIASR